jgi:hypothetical protein
LGDARVLVWGVQEMPLWRGSSDDSGGGHSKYLTTFFYVVVDVLQMRHHGLLWLFLHGILVFGRLGTCPIEKLASIVFIFLMCALSDEVIDIPIIVS